MTRALRIVEATRHVADGEPYLALTLVNGSDESIGPGGLRLIAERTGAPSLLMSVSNHWRIGPGAHVFLSVFLPRDGLKHIDFVDYVGYEGTIYPIGDRLAIGWFFTELKRGMTGADVQT